MNVEDIALLYEYNRWATLRLLTAAELVNHEQLVKPTGHSLGSLRNTLVHTLDAEWDWRILLQSGALSAFDTLKDTDFPDLSILKKRWAEEHGAMKEYIASLTEDDLTRIVRYTLDTGQKRERVLWHCLIHVVNHGTHHRSQAAAILKDLGFSPGGLDFTEFLNNRSQPGS